MICGIDLDNDCVIRYLNTNIYSPQHTLQYQYSHTVYCMSCCIHMPLGLSEYPPTVFSMLYPPDIPTLNFVRDCTHYSSPNILSPLEIHTQCDIDTNCICGLYVPCPTVLPIFPCPVLWCVGSIGLVALTVLLVTPVSVPCGSQSIR